MQDLDISDGAVPRPHGQRTTVSGRGPERAPSPGVPDNMHLKRELLLSKMFPAEVMHPTLGRYDVLEFVGEGGMGTVYAAHDPRLDRKVAIKLLRNASREPRRRARLVREAKALARLSHAHVVTVHEVWDEGGQLYIAMEFVEGQDLAQWQQPPRPWREVLDVYRQAGEGLAAVHEAGLVVRDFKPANVIRREEDGVVKLLDFGLVRMETVASTAPDLPAIERQRSGRPPGSVREPLTRAGTIMGTPAYMAPEQFEGSPASARSDQFSFAVSLWEALYGRRPFVRSVQSTEPVVDEPRIEPPSAHDVPAWIQRVLDRGLAPDPFDRYPSIRALLEDLGRDPSVRRRRILGAIGVVSVAVVGGLVVAELRAEPSSTCMEVSTAWDPARRRGTERGVMQAGGGGAAARQTWALLGPRLDRYADALSTTRRQACEAHRRGLKPEEHYALEVACLDRAEAGLTALVDLFGRAEASAVEQANKAVMELPTPSRCADIDVLRADHAPIEDPVIADQVATLRQELARASAEESAGLYAQAADRAGSVLDAAQRLDYRPLRAEALVRRGSARMQLRWPEAAADLDQSLWLSLATEQRRVAAEAAAKRIFVHADPQGEDRDATEAIALARALSERSGAADWRVRWALSNNIGVALGGRDEPARAMVAFEEALDRLPQADDQGRFEHSVTLKNMAAMQLRMGHTDLALSSNRRSLEEIEAVFGSTHPQVLDARVALARAHRFAGRFAEAEVLLGAVFAGFTLPGSAPPGALFEAAEVALRQGELDAAVVWLEHAHSAEELPSMWREALAAKEAMVGAAQGDATVLDRLDRSGIDIGLTRRAEVLLALGRPARAEALLTPLVDDPEASERYPEFARLLLGRSLVAQGRWVEAQRRLLALVESEGLDQRLGARQRAEAVQALAAAEAGLGRADRARERAEQALQILEGFDPTSVPVREAQALHAAVRSAEADPSAG